MMAMDAGRHVGAKGRALLSLTLLLFLVSGPVLLQLAAALRQDEGQGLLRDMLPLWLHIALTAAVLGLCVRTRYALLLLGPAALLAPFELFYLWKFGQPSASHVYGVIADTNSAETLSWFGPWLWWVVVAGLLLLLLLLWAMRCWWRVDWRWTHRSRIWVLLACLPMLVGLGALEWWRIRVVDELGLDAPNPFMQHSLANSEPGIRGDLENSFPWGLPLRWTRYREHQAALAAHRSTIAQHRFELRWHAGLPRDRRQISVLLIGETGRPDRWGLFGAQRNSTPGLSARNDLLLFKDAVSASSATRESVPLMLTRRPPGAMLEPVAEPSVVTAFRQAGFRTYWLSTQGAAGSHETPISVLASEAHEQHFINAADYRGAGALDGDLLPLLQRVLDRGESRQLIVLHTLGSHLHYAHRYPPEFERFKPALGAEDAPDIWTGRRQPELRNAYDNSVLYTDHVLSEVISQLERTGASATLLYAADHGETLYDGYCQRGGHGFAASVNYRVPMFIWTSPEWRVQRSASLATLMQRRHQPVSTLAVFPTLTGLAGFEVAAPHAHGDLGEAGSPQGRRMVTYFGDFDHELLAKACDAPAKLKASERAP